MIHPSTKSVRQDAKHSRAPGTVTRCCVHSTKSVRQDAKHSRQDAGAPHPIRSNPSKLHMTAPPGFRRNSDTPALRFLHKSRLAPQEIIRFHGSALIRPDAGRMRVRPPPRRTGRSRELPAGTRRWSAPARRPVGGGWAVAAIFSMAGGGDDLQSTKIPLQVRHQSASKPFMHPHDSPQQ
jgi:hypothetical protein